MRGHSEKDLQGDVNCMLASLTVTKKLTVERPIAGGFIALGFLMAAKNEWMVRVSDVYPPVSVR